MTNITSETLKKLAHSILKDTTTLDSDISQLVDKNFWDLCEQLPPK